MAYIKQTWVDRVVQFVRRFSATEDESGKITLSQEPGTVAQEGSPVNAERLNYMEAGIESAHVLADTANSSISQINANIGSREYQENNFVTDGQSVTASIDALDVNLGSVSANLNSVQSGGLSGAFSSMPFVVTAPIVESGSNAYGRWIKYADGTMLCNGEIPAKALTVGINEFAYFLANTFFSISTTFVIATGRPSADWNFNILGNNMTTTSSASVTVQSGAVQNFTYGKYLAVGRWKA